MKTELRKVLIIGASGRVGSQVVRTLDREAKGLSVRLSTSTPKRLEQWKKEGRDAVLLDLNRPETFATALEGIDALFLLTGYTSDMLHQSKLLVDAAVVTGVQHIVHLGVFNGPQDLIPHFSWHVLVETYIKASGMAWTNIHPNVIADGQFVTTPTLKEKRSFTTFSRHIPQGWVFASDIAEVVAAVLSEGKEVHGGKDYWLSIEVLTGEQIEQIFSEVAGYDIRCVPFEIPDFTAWVASISDTSTRAYMESALITAKLSNAGLMQAQTKVQDDVQTVLGRPGLTIRAWAEQYFGSDEP